MGLLACPSIIPPILASSFGAFRSFRPDAASMPSPVSSCRRSSSHVALDVEKKTWGTEPGERGIRGGFAFRS